MKPDPALDHAFAKSFLPNCPEDEKPDYQKYLEKARDLIREADDKTAVYKQILAEIDWLEEDAKIYLQKVRFMRSAIEYWRNYHLRMQKERANA